VPRPLVEMDYMPVHYFMVVVVVVLVFPEDPHFGVEVEVEVVQDLLEE
jgi:hypothetical protein